MRARSKDLKAHLASSMALESKELVRRIGTRGHLHPEHVRSEVLATIVRTGYAAEHGATTAAIEELNERMTRETTRRWRRVAYLPEVRRRGNQFVPDAVTYMWDKFLEEQSTLSNAETVFIAFVRDRFEEFVRHLGTTSNDMDSVDGMDVTDAEGNRDSFISTVADSNAETPEEALIRAQDREKVNRAWCSCPRSSATLTCFAMAMGTNGRKSPTCCVVPSRPRAPTALAPWKSFWEH
jgi:hypothetical protein